MNQVKVTKNLRRGEKAITLIALVITIIVILILSGIALSMMSGENSVLKRAVDAKESTERAEVEEALKLAYMDYVADDVIKGSSSDSRFANAVSKVQSQGYENKLVVKSGGSKSYKLSSSNMILANGETATITVEEDNSATSSSSVYAVIDGKYYEVKNNNGDIKIATKPSEVDSGSSSSSITIGEVSSQNESVVTVIKEENGVKVTAQSTTGTSKIIVTVNGTQKEATVEVVDSIVDLTNNNDYKLDGAMIPGDITAGTGKTVSSNDESIAQVTTEGIVKCGTKTGETTVKIDNIAYKIKSTARIVQAGANKTLDGSTTGTANNPIIPIGFYAINTETAKWKNDENGNNEVTSNVNNGLVIMDEKGNQFVWVPVSEATSMYGVLSNGDYAGKLYTSWSGKGSSGTRSNLNWTETNGVMEIPNAAGVKEPYTVSDDGQTYTPSGSSETKTYLSIIEDTINTKYKSNSEYSDMTHFGNTMQKDFKTMVQSIATNGGFFVGRYESSIINNETRVVAGATSMNATESSVNRWYGLYARQKNFAVDNGLDSVESDMIWGSQYDAMMNWMQDTGINLLVRVTGSNTRNTSRETGTKIIDKKNNVFDLLGNSREWTAEAFDTDNRSIRAGSYSRDIDLCNRVSFRPSRDTEVFSSRPTIYIK